LSYSKDALFSAPPPLRIQDVDPYSTIACSVECNSLRGKAIAVPLVKKNDNFANTPIKRENSTYFHKTRID